MFSRNSYKNTSMSRLADAGGVSKSLLFHYFLNKKELYLYLWEHAGRLDREKVRKGDTQTTDLFEILCQRVLAGCVFMRETPTIYLFILRAFLRKTRKSGKNFRIIIRQRFFTEQRIYGGRQIWTCSGRVLIRSCC